MKNYNLDNLQNRMGIVRLSSAIFFTLPDEQLLRLFFSNFFPVRIEPLNGYNKFTSWNYYGMSPYFEELEEGAVMPEYEFTFKRMDTGRIVIESVVKCEHIAVPQPTHLQCALEEFLKKEKSERLHQSLLKDNGAMLKQLKQSEII